MWVIERQRPRPREARKPFSYAPHLRGKVTIRGNLVTMRVINLHTGETIAIDNTGLNTIYGKQTGLAAMIDDAIESTTAARIAWMRGFGRKTLR